MPKIGARTTALLLFGPPGSGKGTVGKLLTSHYGIPHISTGDILREHIQKGDELGRQVKELLDAGLLVPDELMNELVRKRLKQPDCEGGFILDGYPRTMEQGEFLAEVLRDLEFHPVVVYLDVDYNKIVARLSARRSCPHCGRVYNIESMPPRVDGICDADGQPLVMREDDRPESIRRRLLTYEAKSRDLITYLSSSVPRFYYVNRNEDTPESTTERVVGLISNG